MRKDSPDGVVRVFTTHQVLLKEEEMHVSGVYYSEVTYDQDYPPMWEF